jgi:Histidine kinase-, DNA gyrase B-, and HSP90-like ATPase/Major intrinsic protein
VSGAHFNPAVSLIEAVRRRLPWPDAAAYALVQVLGCFSARFWLTRCSGCRCCSPPFMYEQRPHRDSPSPSRHSGCSWSCSVVVSAMPRGWSPPGLAQRTGLRPQRPSPTRRSQFARSLSDTFAGIRPRDVPLFILAQFLGAFAALWTAPISSRCTPTLRTFNNRLEVAGDVSGVWDIDRLNQLLGNLVVNALKYGAFTSPVRVVLSGLSGEVRFAVHNHGPKIEPSILAQIFEPLKRGPENQFVSGTDGSFGLGLYIAREIAVAHHGDIAATSDDSETVFTVRLPRLSGKGHPPAN